MLDVLIEFLLTEITARRSHGVAQLKIAGTDVALPQQIFIIFSFIDTMPVSRVFCSLLAGPTAFFAEGANIVTFKARAPVPEDEAAVDEALAVDGSSAIMSVFTISCLVFRTNSSIHVSNISREWPPRSHWKFRNCSKSAPSRWCTSNLSSLMKRKCAAAWPCTKLESASFVLTFLPGTVIFNHAPPCNPRLSA